MVEKNERLKFIVFEGAEGAGKGEQMKMLKRKYGYCTEFSREPGGTPLAEAIRDLLMSDLGRVSNAQSQFHLYFAARADHLIRVKKAIESGKNYVSDRFDLSTFAYQIRGLNNPELYQLFHHTRNVMLRGIMPDHYIYLDVDVEVGLKRAQQRGEGNFWDEASIDLHRRIKEGALEFLNSLPSRSDGHPPYYIINANRPLAHVKKSVDRVFRKIIKA